ncbi:MAG: site-specific integrase, partial [Novosphingobium sp.]
MAGEDLAERFLAMLAVERGAAANTLAAYRRDLESAQDILGDLAMADGPALAGLGEAWGGLAASSLARKCSALRQFYGFLVDEGVREDDPSGSLPRPRTRRPLPRVLGHEDVERFLTLAEDEATGEQPGAVRLLALLELLYGSGLRASELVSLPLAAVPRDAPFLHVTGKGGQQRMVPVSSRARMALSRWLAVRKG